MRRWTPALLALGVAGALFGYLRWMDPPVPVQEAARAPDLIQFLDIQPDQVTGLEVAGNGYRLALRREQGAGAAWAVEPSGGFDAGGRPPNADRVYWVLDTLAGLFASRRVADEAGDPAAWGLDQPAWVISVHTGAGSHTLTVGAYQPINNTFYAQRDSDPAVYLIPGTLPDSLPPEAAGWFAGAGV